ncbi:hypothetical protein PMAYCL1PPCAC_21376, partial [Pristionchus mayeri]
FLCFQRPCQAVNQSVMMGAIFGKLLIALHRYFVLRQLALSEKIWPVPLVRGLIALQLIIPFIITGVCYLLGHAEQTVVNGAITYKAAGQGLIVSIAHRNLFIVVAVSSLSHILKAAQQSLIVIYSQNGAIDRRVFETILWPTFVATNGIATYTPPLILIYFSRRIRLLLFGRFSAKIRLQKSTDLAVKTI